jgi:hypothetical protein
MSATRSIAAIIGVVLLTGCAELAEPVPKPYFAPQPDYKAKSLLLKPGMSEQDVTGVLGTPEAAEVNTCGSKTDKPWSCKSWSYNGMRLWFAEVAPDKWRLNSWKVGFPF